MTGFEEIDSTCAIQFFTERAEAALSMEAGKMLPAKTKGSAFAFPLGFLIEEPVISSWLSSLPFS
jgi:hypothetical protein